MREPKFSVKPQSRPKANGSFQQIKVGQVVIPIYCSEAQGFPRYFVTFYERGLRVPRSFTDLAEARREARSVGERVMACKTQAPRLSPAECDQFLAARKALAKTGIGLLAAAREFADCHEMLGGKSLTGAIRDYVERNKGVQADVTVPAAAAEFLASKEQDGASPRYMAQLRSDVNRFAAAFTGTIPHVKSHQIDEWLRQLGGAPRTRNSTHSSIRTFFSCPSSTV